MSLQSEVKPTEVQLLQKFQNSTETKTSQVVCAISKHYKDVQEASSNPNIKTQCPMFGEAGSIMKICYGGSKNDVVIEKSV